MRPVVLIDDGWLVGGFRQFLINFNKPSKIHQQSRIDIWLVVTGTLIFIFHFIYGMSFFPLTNSIIFQDGHIAQPTSWLIWVWFMFFLLQGQDGNLCRGCRLAPLCPRAGKGSSWDTCHSYWMKQLFVACICLSFCRGTPVFETYVFFWDRSPTYEWLLNSLKSQRRESSRRVE